MTDRYDTDPQPRPSTPRTAEYPTVPPGGATAYPGAGGSSPYGTGAGPVTSPDYTRRPVAVRRPDVLAGLLLLLAGAAAAVSLLLRWVADDDATGLDLVRLGLDGLGAGVRELVDTGYWQPLTVVLGGGVLAVIGLLVFLPAKRHRFLGLLALLVAGAVTAAVLVPLVQADWDAGRFDLGFWFACAVAVLGLLGALKALLTGKRVARS